ncbi:uncharacterized protein PRCAT00001435001 [Priceomyces carsonii]|uniref:uncharacterized protein n=1 Tax=Priceomyces carsonii TaxID=28549 RepID=UPI002EDAEF7A|nr:unnamed protein product [Priceomyces carsonii]
MTLAFDPISAHEIKLSSSLTKKSVSDPVRFRTIDVLEPLKDEMIPFLEAQLKGLKTPTRPDRRIKVYYYIVKRQSFFKAIVNLDTNTVESTLKIPKGIQLGIDMDEAVEIEDACNSHPLVLAELERLNLPKNARIYNDPWNYGTDNRDETMRLFQCYMYIGFSDDPECNHYANPLPISPVFD